MTEEQLFREWITENWQDQYHNFSKLENGHYYFSSMQDAWGVWRGCLSTHSVFNRLNMEALNKNQQESIESND